MRRGKMSRKMRRKMRRPRAERKQLESRAGHVTLGGQRITKGSGTFDLLCDSCPTKQPEGLKVSSTELKTPSLRTRLFHIQSKVSRAAGPAPAQWSSSTLVTSGSQLVGFGSDWSRFLLLPAPGLSVPSSRLHTWRQVGPA